MHDDQRLGTDVLARQIAWLVSETAVTRDWPEATFVARFHGTFHKEGLRWRRESRNRPD